LAGGLAGLGEGMGFNEVADGFGLGEVETAGKKGALGEFAGLGEARAEDEGAAKQELENDGRAVRCYFDEIFGGVGVGRSEESDESFVDAGGIACCVIENIGETRAGVLERLAEADKLGGDGSGLRTAEAHDADAAAAGGRGDGGDGVGVRRWGVRRRGLAGAGE